MKYILKFKWAWLALAASICFGAMACPGCGDKPTVKPPVGDTITKPIARIIPDSEFCKTIAGITQSTAVGTKGKYWPQNQTIQVGFIGGTASQRKYVTDAFALWQDLINLKITYPEVGPYKIRVAFNSGSGSWSYVGTDCTNIAQNQPTMNIGWSGLDVCIHEAAHALGASHEQSSPNSDIQWNKEVVYAALGGSPNFWSRATVDFNVFRKLTQAEADATIYDPLSIMQYSVPASWTYNYPSGIPGGKVLSALDKSFWAAQYPKAINPPPPPTPTNITITKAKADSIKVAAKNLTDMVNRILK